MKLVLTGATGYVGSEVLRQALSNSKVSSVVTLTRRPLSESKYTESIDASNQKLTSVIVKDMTAEYPTEVIEQLKGADGVIWNVGTIPGNHSPEETRKTSVDMPNAAVKAFTSGLQASGQGPLRFVYVSGEAVERNQDVQGLWWKPEFRKLRGLGEQIFIDAEANNPTTFKSYIMKMGPVVSGLGSVLALAPYIITLQHAAASMIEVALNGSELQTLRTADMKIIGQKALDAKR